MTMLKRAAPDTEREDAAIAGYERATSRLPGTPYAALREAAAAQPFGPLVCDSCGHWRGEPSSSSFRQDYLYLIKVFTHGRPTTGMSYSTSPYCEMRAGVALTADVRHTVILRRMLRDDCPRVVAWVAASSLLTWKQVAVLAEHEDYLVRQAMSARPDLPANHPLGLEFGDR